MQVFKSVITAVVLVAATAAQADTFNFSYVFDRGAVMTGSFEGRVSGNEVVDLSNVSVSHDGIAFNGNGNLFAYAWHRNFGWLTGAAVASFDGTQNNFHFSDVDYSKTSTFTNLFTANPLNSPTTNEARAYWPGLGEMMVNDHGYAPQRWSLTNVSAVPEPETYTLTLVGLGLVGAFARRRKTKQS